MTRKGVWAILNPLLFLSVNKVTQHINTIHQLFGKSESCGIPIWLESGWAIDARLGQITRDHEDIDIAFPWEQNGSFFLLLKELGFRDYVEMDYGFIMSKGDIIIDAEPCFL